MTFGTVAVILSVVFIVLMVDARDRVRTAETEKLSVAERVFTALEARRQLEQLATIATVAENPTLKAALDTYIHRAQFRRPARRPGNLAARYRHPGSRETGGAHRGRRAGDSRCRRIRVRERWAVQGPLAA